MPGTGYLHGAPLELGASLKHERILILGPSKWGLGFGCVPICHSTSSRRAGSRFEPGIRSHQVL